MHETQQRPRWTRSVIGAAALIMAMAGSVGAQVVACDFDIADDLGVRVWGSTVHLTGRAGAGTDIGKFVLINGNTPDTDVDKDGYALACNYSNIYIDPVFRTNLVNVEDPSIVIPAASIIINNLPRTLNSGTQARVDVRVELPAGTPAGRYLGEFQVRDLVIFATGNPATNQENLNVDLLRVEVIVVAEPDINLIEANSAEELDSVVLRGRAGQRASEIFRLANAGNAPLSDIRLSATDLRSESAVNLVIPSNNVSFSIPSLSGIELGDTARITVSVDIPRGILGGRYRGFILVQSQGVSPQQVPLIVIVTSTRGILFANNPVRSFNGVANIAFNGDPGTGFKVGIFDMSGLMVFQIEGTVFAGVSGTATAPGSGADFAQSVTWPLVNGRGEQIASGMYLVVVESTVERKRQLATDRLMVIR